jgi:hypothetical protein
MDVELLLEIASIIFLPKVKNGSQSIGRAPQHSDETCQARGGASCEKGRCPEGATASAREIVKVLEWHHALSRMD